MTIEEAVPGTCMYCQCTEAQACEGGCGWADETQTVCTSCVGAASIAQQVIEIFGQLAEVTTAAARLRLMAAPWEDLTISQRRLLADACRTVIGAHVDQLLLQTEQDLLNAAVEYKVLLAFLLEHCPQEIRNDELLSETIQRLLEPHVGSRIVLPGSTH